MLAPELFFPLVPRQHFLPLIPCVFHVYRWGAARGWVTVEHVAQTTALGMNSSSADDDVVHMAMGSGADPLLSGGGGGGAVRWRAGKAGEGWAENHAALAGR